MRWPTARVEILEIPSAPTGCCSWCARRGRWQSERGRRADGAGSRRAGHIDKPGQTAIICPVYACKCRLPGTGFAVGSSRDRCGSPSRVQLRREGHLPLAHPGDVSDNLIPSFSIHSQTESQGEGTHEQKVHPDVDRVDAGCACGCLPAGSHRRAGCREQPAARAGNLCRRPTLQKRSRWPSSISASSRARPGLAPTIAPESASPKIPQCDYVYREEVARICQFPMPKR